MIASLEIVGRDREIGIDEKVRELERLSLGCVEHGMPPPKQIYDAPYRERIDWVRFPVWAQPSDPELFNGSPHEG
jgi:hypothetical protein